jgi:hypothetical protein
VLDDGMIEFGKSGNRNDKRQIMAALAAAPANETPADFLEMTDVNAMQLSPDAVLLTYRLVARPGAPDSAIPSLRSSVWKRNGGAWRLIFHQGTKTGTGETGGVRTKGKPAPTASGR